MKIFKVTAEHLNNGEYNGPDLSVWIGHIEISADLGLVRFNGSLTAAGRIIAEAGSGIEAGEGIKAGWGIEAKWLSCALRIFAGLVNWRLPRPSDLEIRAEIRGGKVALGTVIEVP